MKSVIRKTLLGIIVDKTYEKQKSFLQKIDRIN